MSFLFGSSKSTTELPQWLEAPAREMLQRSIDMGKTGYMPYAGPQVAAFDPAQVAAMRNTDQAAQAFGMHSAMPRIPDAQDFGNGVWGYSSLPLYEQQQQWMTENRPGQKSFYDGFFVDPFTGQNGANMEPTLNQKLQDARAREMEAAIHRGPANEAPGSSSPGHGREGGGMFGGYNSLSDMFDGGGPGTSGGGSVGGLAGDIADIATGDFWGGW